jgi:hypothetical protein
MRVVGVIGKREYETPNTERTGILVYQAWLRP